MAHILVVDDDFEIRRLVARMLQIQGHEAVLAGNGADALEVVGNQKIDLIVSDLRMPVMDGQVLFTKLRAQGYLQPFIFISGHATEDTEAVIEADAFLAKPFTFADLVKTVEEVLTRVPA